MTSPFSSGVLVSVYQPDGSSLIAHVPRRRNVQWQDELNVAGSAQFEIHLDDELLIATPTLIAPFNIVKFSYKGTLVKAWQIEEVSQTFTSSGERAERWVTVTGRGLLSLFESAVVYPEYPLRAYTPEDRPFNFTNKDGLWRRPEQWQAPIGVKQSEDLTARKGSPRGWPDPDAQWIWPVDPRTSSPAGRCWFRGKITVTELTDVVLYASADNSFALWVDSVHVLQSPTAGVGVWRQLFQIIVRLEPGEHVIAAWVDNWEQYGATSTSNPGGFICSVWTIDKEGRPKDNLFRSSPSTFIVKPWGNTPGWNSATIFIALLKEAQARNVAPVLPVSLGFTHLADSAGNAWRDVQGGDLDNSNEEYTAAGIQIQDRTFKIGTTDLYDALQQLIELTFDVDLGPDFVLRAWIKRGTDKSGTIIIAPFVNATQSSLTTRSGRVRNQILVQSNYGWVEAYNTASQTLHGRREGALNVGNAESVQQSGLVAAASLREVARPDVTVPVSYTSAIGPQPYLEYDVGDTITVPGHNGVPIRARVMSISASETESVISWDLDCYPIEPEDTVHIYVPPSTEYREKLYPIEPLLPVDPTPVA